MLIGNKADLTAERAVRQEDGIQVAKVSQLELESDRYLGHLVTGSRGSQKKLVKSRGYITRQHL